jgi:hypothetical protein
MRVRTWGYRNDVIIRNEETGLVLPSAPEFDADGTWPPVTTDWTPMRWGLFEAEQLGEMANYAYVVVNFSRQSQVWVITDSLLTDINLHEGVLQIPFWHRSLFRLKDQPLASSKDLTPFLVKDFSFLRKSAIPLTSRSRYELRRLVHAERWQRHDPVIQLPPGATHEVTHSVTTGLTAEGSQALSKALGLNLGGNVAGIQAGISSQLTRQFGLRLEITAQQEQAKKLTLSNQSASRYTRYALWHVDHRVTVTALELLPSSVVMKDGGAWTKDGEDPRARWAPRGEAEFAASDDMFITFTEIDRS